MSIDDLIKKIESRGGSIGGEIKKEKITKNESNREKFINYMNGEISKLEERKSLVLEYRDGKKGKVKEVRGWSDVKEGGMRHLRFKVSNYTIYLTKEFAKLKHDVRIGEDVDYNGVISYMKDVRDEYENVKDEDVSFYRRVKDKDSKKWKVVVVK
jgi:hypothetical protein